MSNRIEEFTALLNTGKIEEAKAMLAAEMIKAKYEPDTFISEDGKPPKFMKRGKLVERGEDGMWRLKPRKASKAEKMTR